MHNSMPESRRPADRYQVERFSSAPRLHVSFRPLNDSDSQSFGKYLLLDRIAAGGMAEIYRARYQAAAGVTKQVVIKKILPHYAGNRNFIQMFINEARIVVGLSHGNIAQVFDFGEIDGEYYLAMEFVHGQPLSKVLRRARELQIPVLPTPFACFIALEMCRGLHYAHTRLDEKGRPLGIIHRDVSPQNIILSYEGQVKLVDFGIAKARTAGRTETEAGAVKGKYVYFAPEQARGKELDARTDVFACGIVLYEMLCGRLPFEGKMIEVLSKIVKCEFERPRAVNPDITPALERIILTAMAADKNDRYPTAQAMGDALAQYLYANAPTFSSEQMSKLLGFLYEKELVAEGLPVQLPRDFLEQVPLWKKHLPAMGEPQEKRPTTASRPSRRRSKPEEETRAAEPTRVPTPGPRKSKSQRVQQHEEPGPKKTPWALFAALPVAAAVLAAVAVFLIGRGGSFNVQLTSTPPGAVVMVDGAQAPKTTPLLISDLAVADEHRLDVSAPGHKPWSKQLRGGRDETIAVEAKLEPDRLPKDLMQLKPPELKPVVAVETAKPSVVTDYSYPAQDMSLDAVKNAFDLAPTHAARIRLDPSKTYKVWTEGKLSLGGLLDNIFFDQVWYYVEGEVAPDESFGLVGSKGVTVKNATALYAWIFDVKSSDNSGAIKVRIQAKGGGTSTLVVDAREHYVDLEANLHRSRLTGLDRFQSYEVVIKDANPEAALCSGANCRVRKVAYVQNSGMSVVAGKSLANADQRVMEVGKKYEVSGAAWMMFAFPDGRTDDNAGGFKVEVTAIAGSGSNTGLKKLIGDGRMK